MNQYNKMTREEIENKAFALVRSMTDEQAALALRVLTLDDEAITALLASDCRGYNEVLAFVSEWERRDQ